MVYKSMSTEIRSVLLTEKVQTAKPVDREVGTDSLVDTYKDETPGQEEVVDESTKAELAALAAKAVADGARVKKVKTGSTSGFSGEQFTKAAQNGYKIAAPIAAQHKVLTKQQSGDSPVMAKKKISSVTRGGVTIRRFVKEEELEIVDESNKDNKDNKQKKKAVIPASKRFKDLINRDFDIRNLKRSRQADEPKKAVNEDKTVDAEVEVNKDTKPRDLKAQQKIKIIDERKNHGLSKALIEASKLIQEKSAEEYAKKIAEELAYKKANGYIK